MFKVHTCLQICNATSDIFKALTKKVAESVCCGTLINKMAVSDETSLISSEVECMRLHKRVSYQVERRTQEISERIRVCEKRHHSTTPPPQATIISTPNVFHVP